MARFATPVKKVASTKSWSNGSPVGVCEASAAAGRTVMMPTTTPTILLKLFIGQPFRPSPVPRTAWPTTASRPSQDVGRVGGDPLRPRLKSSRWLHAKADALDSLESEISETGTMVTGSAGQPVLHPAVAEAR